MNYKIKVLHSLQVTLNYTLNNMNNNINYSNIYGNNMYTYDNEMVIRTPFKLITPISVDMF